MAKPPTHPDNLAKGGDDSTNVLTYLTKQDRKKLLAAYQLLMSLGMSTEQLIKTATRLGATRMREPLAWLPPSTPAHLLATKPPALTAARIPSLRCWTACTRPIARKPVSRTCPRCTNPD